MPSLTPSDSLWVAILEREPRLESLEPDAVRAHLAKGGFPDHVIEAYLRKHPRQRRHTKAATGR